jgi:hypothetical protein
MTPYEYEIISVDESAGCMEIVYTSEGKPPMHIGARLPYEGETVKAVVDMYAPVSYWTSLNARFAPVAVGLKGEHRPPEAEPMTLERAKAEKMTEIAAWRYRREVNGIEVNGVQVRTDRESQALINTAYANLKGGMVASVNWKSGSGNFVAFDLTAMEQIARAVAQHVQACFDAESVLAQQVNAAQTIDAVNAIAAV